MLFCLIGAASCSAGGSGDATQDIDERANALPGDTEIISKAYDSFYKVPTDFHTDDRENTPRSYSLYHVKDVSVSYELCSDDFDEALGWEAADNESRSVGGYYVGSREDERYFEFIRELAYPDGVGNIDDLTSPGFARVFKCSYVNRDGADRNLRDGYAGTFNSRPLSIDSMKTYAEYMWQFTFFWPARKTVLETFSSEQPNAYQHTLVLAFVSNQGADKCDLVELVNWVFTVDKSDGTITKKFELVRRMEAQLVDGAPQLCVI